MAAAGCQDGASAAGEEEARLAEVLEASVVTETGPLWEGWAEPLGALL